jgi:hypothetical protein
MTPWEKAKLLRKRAAICKTRTGVIKLLIQARYYEQQSNFTPSTGASKEQSRQDDDTVNYRLPLWFKKAWAALRCIRCNNRTGTYWYRQEGTNYSRVRLMPSVKAGNYDRAKILMKSSIGLCRNCLRS